MSNVTPREKRRHAAGREKSVSPFLAWGDFHARSHFALPEEKWGTTRSLNIFACCTLRPFAHPVACCRLGVVMQSLKPVKLFSQQLPTFLFYRDRRSIAQQCQIRLHSSSYIVRATHAHYAWFTKTYGFYPSHVHCRSQHSWELLHPFAHHCQHARINSTMLGVVASVCTQPHMLYPASHDALLVSTLLGAVASVCTQLILTGKRTSRHSGNLNLWINLNVHEDDLQFLLLSTVYLS